MRDRTRWTAALAAFVLLGTVGLLSFSMPGEPLDAAPRATHPTQSWIATAFPTGQAGFARARN